MIRTQGQSGVRSDNGIGSVEAAVILAVSKENPSVLTVIRYLSPTVIEVFNTQYRAIGNGGKDVGRRTVICTQFNTFGIHSIVPVYAAVVPTVRKENPSVLTVIRYLSPTVAEEFHAQYCAVENGVKDISRRTVICTHFNTFGIHSIVPVHAAVVFAVAKVYPTCLSVIRRFSPTVVEIVNTQ